MPWIWTTVVVVFILVSFSVVVADAVVAVGSMCLNVFSKQDISSLFCLLHNVMHPFTHARAHTHPKIQEQKCLNKSNGQLKMI